MTSPTDTEPSTSRDWDTDSHDKVRNAMIALGETLTDANRMFGLPDQVDPVRHLIGTAIGWGGNNEHDAFYAFAHPEHNDGETVYRLTLRDLPIDSWWGVSVYNAAGYFEKNDRDNYTINSLNGVADAGGAFTIQFGGCADDTANCLPIFPDWNYAVRLYRPHQEVIDGTWTLPEAQPTP